MGKGLDALIGPAAAERPRGGPALIELDVEAIVPSEFQPRRGLDETKMAELVQSVQRDGLLQPILVRRAGDKYEIIAGERRWRAAVEVGLKTVPAVLREVSDPDMLRVALVENLQREDLNPIEEAGAYRELMERFGLTQEDLATEVGKDRSTVANALRLLKLPQSVQDFLSRGALTVGHARALLALPTSEAQVEVAQRIVRDDLSVRDTEKLVKDWQKRRPRRSPRRTAGPDKLDPQLAFIQEVLQRFFGTRVRLVHGAKKGRIEIEYYGADDLNRILELLEGVLRDAGGTPPAEDSTVPD